MSTTRHLVNRQRRLAAVTAERTTAAPSREATPDEETQPTTATQDGAAAAREDREDREDREAPEGAGEKPGPPSRRTPRPRIRLPAVLCALTVLLGAFAAWAFTSAADLRDEPGRQNTALTDISATSEVKGQITEAAGAVFSYDYASPEKSERAAKRHLTGKAVQQHRDMLAQVRAQAPEQKLVLTTTVTEAGVELLDGDRARLLIFADQSNTRTGKAEETTYAAAMFAVDAVHRGDTWQIAAIDTFTR